MYAFCSLFSHYVFSKKTLSCKNSSAIQQAECDLLHSQIMKAIRNSKTMNTGHRRPRLHCLNTDIRKELMQSVE